MHPGAGQGAVVDLPQQVVVACQRGHGGVDVHQGDVLDAGVAQDLARQEPVPAPQDEHVGGPLHGGQGAAGQGLVVAPLVQGGELQLVVQVEPQVGAVLGNDDLLGGGLVVVDDRVAVGGRTH